MITREEIIKDLEVIFHQIDTDDDFVLEEPFYNLGMNSLDEVDFLMHVESKYGISIADDIANKIEKPSDYIDLIMEALNQEAQS